MRLAHTEWFARPWPRLALGCHLTATCGCPVVARAPHLVALPVPNAPILAQQVPARRYWPSGLRDVDTLDGLVWHTRWHSVASMWPRGGPVSGFVACPDRSHNYETGWQRPSWPVQRWQRRVPGGQRFTGAFKKAIGGT